MRFIDFFDRAYVINLPTRPDRCREMAEELEKAGMPFTLGKVELFEAIKPESPAPFESIGIKGCFLSHLNILKKAQVAGLRNVLIMEDDLELRKEFQQFEEIIIKKLIESDWDIVNFGHYIVDFGRQDSDSSLQDITTAILQSFSGEIIGAHFYAVNGKVLDQLIDFLEVLLDRPLGHPEGSPMPIDGALNVFKWQNPKVVRLIVVPCLGKQRSSRSDISPKWFDKFPVLKFVTSLARKWGLIKFFKNLRNLLSSSAVQNN